MEVRLRHGPQRIPARLRILPGGAAEVELDRPDPGIAPGQFSVFYQGRLCLGSGIVADAGGSPTAAATAG